MTEKDLLGLFDKEAHREDYDIYAILADMAEDRGDELRGKIWRTFRHYRVFPCQEDWIIRTKGKYYWGWGHTGQTDWESFRDNPDRWIASSDKGDYLAMPEYQWEAFSRFMGPTREDIYFPSPSEAIAALADFIQKHPELFKDQLNHGDVIIACPGNNG